MASMETAVARPQETAVAEFKPQEAKRAVAKATALIDLAKDMKDWPTLRVAVEEKMVQQGQFVEWWEKSVRGKGEKANVPARGHFVADAEAETGITKQQVSKWRRRLKEPEKYQAMLYGAAYSKAMAEANNTTATKWTGDPESYTPGQYIESARTVMGGIDLDPASNAMAQETVKAEEWYDAEEDGLRQEWKGRVFLNPPYAFPTIAHFIEKLCQEFAAGNVTAAVLLTNNNTDTKWWHLAAEHASGVCFTRGRINFYKEDGSVTQPTNGQNFFYLGPDFDIFADVFAEHGLVMPTRRAD